MRMIPLGCKNIALKFFFSFQHQIYMFLSSQERSLEGSFRVNQQDNSYMGYASTESLKCFECGDVRHKRFSCWHKVRDNPQPPMLTSRDAVSNREFQMIERKRQGTVQIDRLTEEVKEQN